MDKLKTISKLIKGTAQYSRFIISPDIDRESKINAEIKDIGYIILPEFTTNEIGVFYNADKNNHVIIHKLIDGVFFSNIVCEKKNKIIKIDSRTSDAIALSLRFSAPIFVNKKVLDEAGFEDDERYSEEIKLTDDSFFETYKTDSADDNISRSKDLKKISTNKIKKMLEKSIQNEDYIMAAKLRDELKIRKSVK